MGSGTSLPFSAQKPSRLNVIEEKEGSLRLEVGSKPGSAKRPRNAKEIFRFLRSKKVRTRKNLSKFDFEEVLRNWKEKKGKKLEYGGGGARGRTLSASIAIRNSSRKSFRVTYIHKKMARVAPTK